MKEHLDRDKIKAANINYHESVADYYDEANTLEHPHYIQSYKDIFRDHLRLNTPDEDGSLILDAGCGTGFLLQFIDQPSRKKVFASDITPRMLQIASSKYSFPGYFRGDSYSLPIKDNTFDYVLCNSLLHHLYDWESAVVELARVLKKGGILFVGSEPNANIYRILNPLRKIYHKFARNKKIGSAIEAGGLSNTDEEMAEFHRFYEDGIDANKLCSILNKLGAKKTETIYTNIGFWVSFSYRTKVDIVRFLPSSVGTLSVSFHCIARF